MLDAPLAAAASPAVTETVEALILGAGFAGTCAAVQLQKSGCTSFLVLEKSAEIGGTWRDNTYPGCACDVPSHLYSLSFAPKTDWTRMYAPQPEIRDYARSVIARFNLAPHIRCNAKIRELAWDETRALWTATAEDGRRFEARFVFAGMGPLHIPTIPEIPGAADFAGVQFHSAQWRHDVDLTGKRVAVIGTGASAIQFIPEVAARAAALVVFQRTPAWIMPRLDYEFTPSHQRRMRNPLLRRLFRFRIYLTNELRALGFLGNRVVAAAGRRMALAHLAAQIKDPTLRAKLTPDYAMGCKRVLISNDFYPALARPNVTLQTSNVAEIRPHAILARDGTEYPADVIIYGTGFHTTDSFSAITITGRNNLTLAESFKDGMHAHWGITVPDFPNLFFLLGPNTGLGHNSVVLMIEAQVRYVMSLLRQMARQGWRAAAVRADVERAWNEKIQKRLAHTVWMQGGCRSWYLDENGRNTTIWPGFVAEYQWKTRSASLKDFERVT